MIYVGKKRFRINFSIIIPNYIEMLLSTKELENVRNRTRNNEEKSKIRIKWLLSKISCV